MDNVVDVVYKQNVYMKQNIIHLEMFGKAWINVQYLSAQKWYYYFLIFI